MDEQPDVLGSLEAAKRGSSQRVGKIAAVLVGVAVIAAAGVMFVIPTFAPSQPEPAPQSSTPGPGGCAPGATAEQCPERQEFLDIARVFATDVKPQIEAVSLSKWDAPAHAQITDLEASANESFGRARYVDATNAMREAVELGQMQIERAAQEFVRALVEAMQSLEVGDPEAAQSAINLALTIDPSHQEAQQYASRIAVLPQVLDLLEAASVAQIENRPRAELDALRQVMQLDAARPKVAARIDALLLSNREQRYSEAVRRTESALQAGRLQEARTQLQAAQQIDPNRDLSSLLQRIEQAERLVKVRNLLAAADRAITADDWATAGQHYASVLATEPGNARAVAGQQDARAVVDGMQKLQPLLDDPMLMTDREINGRAQARLASVESLTGKSPRLDQAMAAVRHALDQAGRDVSVRVLTDGNTYVRVLKVGQVGKHKEKVIRLKPGKYEFEGSKPGYRNTLLSVEIPLDATSLDVTVVCNEPV